MSADPLYPRSDKAARTVDPMLLASALDHIARTASRSRSQTRRLRWIQQRAELALSGQEYRDIDVDLPKSPGPASHERMGKHIHALKLAVSELLTYAERFAEPSLSGTGEPFDRLQLVMTMARSAIAPARDQS